MLRDTATKRIQDGVIYTTPTFYILNQLRRISLTNDTLFIHKLVEYSGWLEPAAAATGTTFVRICIVQPRRGGQTIATDTPSAVEVFGTSEPTIATAINEDDFVRISDRHYLLGTKPLRLDYSHRLSSNMSHQQPTVGEWNTVWMGPMFMCTIAERMVSAFRKNWVGRTYGWTAPIPSTADIDLGIDDDEF